MKIKGSIPMKYKPAVPSCLNGRVVIIATCDLTKHEAELFYLALYCISKLVDGGEPVLGCATVVFTDSDEITITQDAFSCGCYVPIIMYPVHVWRELEIDDWQMLTVMLEELCHSLWLIFDELEVKRQVVKAAQVYDKDIVFEELYPGFRL